LAFIRLLFRLLMKKQQQQQISEPTLHKQNFGKHHKEAY
jgi:hypothetical protein